jgi:hypothetical protein
MGYVVIGWDEMIIPTGWYRRLAVRVLLLYPVLGYKEG